MYLKAQEIFYTKIKGGRLKIVLLLREIKVEMLKY